MKAVTSVLLLASGLLLSRFARAEFHCKPTPTCEPCQISGPDNPQITEAQLLQQPTSCQPGQRARYAKAAACIDSTGTCEPNYSRAIQLLTPLECVMRIGGSDECDLPDDWSDTISDGRDLLAQIRKQAEPPVTKPPEVVPPIVGPAIDPAPHRPLDDPPVVIPPPEPPWGVWLAGAMVFDENGKDSLGGRGGLGGEVHVAGPLQIHGEVLFGKQFMGGRLGLGVFWGSPDFKVGPALDVVMLPIRYNEAQGDALFGGHLGAEAGLYVGQDVRLLGGLGVEAYASAAPYDGFFFVASLGTEWRPR
jgi:hypothetical protein